MSNDTVEVKVNIPKQVFECLRTSVFYIEPPKSDTSIYSHREEETLEAIANVCNLDKPPFVHFHFRYIG